MIDPRLEDHVVGLELQLVELVEQEQRAEIQGRAEDAARLENEIQALQFELADTAERLSVADEQDTISLQDRPEVHAASAQEFVNQS